MLSKPNGPKAWKQTIRATARIMHLFASSEAREMLELGKEKSAGRALNR
jgi:hypothetical protein